MANASEELLSEIEKYLAIPVMQDVIGVVWAAQWGPAGFLLGRIRDCVSPPSPMNWHLNPPAEARDCLVHGEPCRKPCESDEKKESCDVAEGDKEDPIKDCFGTRSGGHDISFNLAQVPDGTAEPGRNMLKQLTFAPAQFAGTSLEEYGSVSVPLKSSIQSKVEVPTKRRSALAASQGDQKVIRHVLPPTDPVSGDAFTRSGYPASGTHPRQATTNWDACVHPEIVSQGPLTERAFDPTDPLPRPLTRRSFDPTDPLPSRESIQGRLSIKSGAIRAIALSRRCVSGPTFYRKSNSDGRSMAQTPNRRRAPTSGSHEGGIGGRGTPSPPFVPRVSPSPLGEGGLTFTLTDSMHNEDDEFVPRLGSHYLTSLLLPTQSGITQETAADPSLPPTHGYLQRCSNPGPRTSTISPETLCWPSFCSQAQLLPTDLHNQSGNSLLAFILLASTVVAHGPPQSVRKLSAGLPSARKHSC
ncbi:unnamed protein product [Cyprideis torosa]|uniref:Uncharacterized protein n=1 Tax=Cyprideis torosa TaxID=163714 RepID=A0A7R8W859_9CRUS|nr:unnamed protein product [Cyprideis torosa]CAG0888275.1 unnamed protein product [Cyprideis torosa]